jgi:hypothetical protein
VNFFSRLASNHDLPISASQVARKIGMSQQNSAYYIF